MKVYLIRHGESVGNKLNIHQGQKNNLPLTDRGVEQARRVSDKLKNQPISAIYSSDLKRAYQTAKTIGDKHPIGIINDERLRERDFGTLEDKNNLVKHWKEYVKKAVEETGIDPEKVRAPEGESDLDHWNRLKEFLDEALKKHLNETIVVLAHAGSNKVLLGIIGHYSKKEMYKTYQGNTGINIFEYSGGSWNVEIVNDISHLPRDANAIEIYNRVKKRDSNLSFNERWKINKELFNELKKAGYRVKYAVCSFSWENQDIPKNLLNLKHPSVDKHLIVLVKSQGIYQKLDLSENHYVKETDDWNSYRDSKLSIDPNEIIEESHDKNFPEDYEKSIRDKSLYNEFYTAVAKSRGWSLSADMIE